MDQELNPEGHQLWLLAIQILVHSEQLFVVFQIKKIQWKLEDHLLEEALHAILYQKL